MKASVLRLHLIVFALSKIFVSGSALFAQQDVQPADTPAALNFTMQTLEGEEVDLSSYAGKVVLFVNVASKCGLTPQYEVLQGLHEEYAEQGLAIVGVPCRQFGNQEFEDNAKIAEFCNQEYGVSFDMLARVDVNGDDQCGLYQHLTSLDLEPKGAGKVGWNFEKFLLDRSGTPIARFGSRVAPDSEEFVAAIEDALAAEGEEIIVPYSHRSAKLDREYFLFSKDVMLKNSNKKRKIYFFAKDPNNPNGQPLSAVPQGYMVSETKTGMLVLKKQP